MNLQGLSLGMCFLISIHIHISFPDLKGDLFTE
jgi:hypothetical protein